MSPPRSASGVAVDTPRPGVERWWLDRPERKHALGPAALEWLAERAATTRATVIVWTARPADSRRGPIFSAGFDLEALAEIAGESAPPDEALTRAAAALEACPATTIAALDGLVLGAAVELAAAFDLRVATARTRFQIPAGRLGVAYHAEGLARLVRMFGPTRAAALVLAGRGVDARELEPSGALELLAEPERLEATVLALAGAIAASPPEPLAANRAILRALGRAPAIPEDLLIEHRAARARAFSRLARPATGGPGDPLSSAPMSIAEQIQAAFKQARLDKDEPTKQVIGMLKSKLLVELKSGSGAVEDDALWTKVLTAYRKELKKSYQAYVEAGARGDEALAGLRFELDFCARFLPEQLDEAQTEAILRALAQAQGLNDPKQAGRLVGAALKAHKDQLDPDLARDLAQRILAESAG